MRPVTAAAAAAAAAGFRPFTSVQPSSDGQFNFTAFAAQTATNSVR